MPAQRATAAGMRRALPPLPNQILAQWPFWAMENHRLTFQPPRLTFQPLVAHTDPFPPVSGFIMREATLAWLRDETDMWMLCRGVEAT